MHFVGWSLVRPGKYRCRPEWNLRGVGEPCIRLLGMYCLYLGLYFYYLTYFFFPTNVLFADLCDKIGLLLRLRRPVDPHEILPNSMRSRSFSIIVSIHWIFDFVIGLTAKYMMTPVIYGTYNFFNCFCFMGGVFVYYLVSDTKDKTREAMDVRLEGTKGDIAATDREKTQKIEAWICMG